MENARFNNKNNDTDDDNESEINSKKKKAETFLGAWVVEKKPNQEKAEDKKDSFWERPSEKDDKEKPAADEELKVEDVAEASEAEAPTDHMSQEEVQYVEQQYAQAKLSSETPDAQTDPEEAAVHNFYEKIVDKEPSEEALAETLADIGEEVEAEEVVEAEPEAVELGEGEILLNHEDSLAEDDTPPPPNPFGPLDGPPTPPSILEPTTPDVVLVPDRQREATNFILGGVLGYLIGRRRGRIKTEKRLIPIQKKLEKQVKGLQENLESKERVIRDTVKKRQNSERQLTVEANNRRPAKLPAEKIGKVLVTAEALPVAKIESKNSKPELSKTEKLNVEKRVETLSREELLQLSEKVIVEATTLRQLYETHLIGEKGLRRLMLEHMRGGDVKRQLRRELVERQIDFERDPILRDSSPVESAQRQGSVALKQMFKEVNQLSPSEAKEELAIYKAREVHQVADKIKQKRQRRRADLAMVSLITVLAVAVLVLLLSRH